MVGSFDINFQLQKQGYLDEIGKFTEMEREMNLNADRKRLWIDRLESVDNTQSNLSIPLCLDIIPKMN